MKKSILLAVPVLLAITACGGKKEAQPAAQEQETALLTYLCDPMGEKIDSAYFPVDSDGYIVIFNGENLTGWRGWARDTVASRWSIDDEGSLHFVRGEGDGGDIMFAHPFENFDVCFDWKVSEGANSGFFYLATETVDGQLAGLAYLSAPEYQILDNVNHPDASRGVDGNRQSASLYDLVPAVPQNSNPWGEWNTARVVVNNGHVEHYQNGEKVLEYEIFTPEWTERLQGSKFSEESLPEAFALMNPAHPGYFAFQDHGDEVWYRNVRVKDLSK